MPTPQHADVNMLAAALRYASLGWPVFPLHTPDNGGCSCADPECKSIGKHPRTKDGFKSATTDEGRIRGWWRTWPFANIGVSTGAKSGFFVLDVDPDHGGDATLGMLVSEHGQLPHTVEAFTGSGGRHVLFQHPGRPVPNSTQRLGSGLDVRGDGGYIVAAPSMHRAGRAYEWQPGCAPGACDLAPSPDWLLELLKPRPAPVPMGSPPAQMDRAYQRARDYVAKMPGAVSGQGGHNALWNVAVVCVRGFRLSESEAFALILSEYNPRCDPPWNEKEVLHKVEDASRNCSVPYGYLLDSGRTSSTPPRVAPPQEEEAAPPESREPGSDDGEEVAPAATPTAEATQPAKAVKKSRLNLLPVSVLLAEQLPETEWLIKPWLETQVIAAMVSPPNLGKTLLAFWCATQVDGRVAIIEEEGGRRGFRKRIDRALKAAPESKALIDFSFKPHVGIVNRADLVQMAAELKDYRLVVIDSLARVCTGVDENDTKEMGMVVAALDYLREKTGATILTVHHTGKAKWKPGEVPRLEDGRGSSALAAGIDTVIALAPVPEEKREPGVVAFELHVTKQRDEDSQVRAQFVTIAMTGPSADVKMIEKERPPRQTDLRAHAILHMVFNAIPEPPAAAVTREFIQDEVGKRAADVRRAIDILIDQKKVKELSKKRLIRVPSNYQERSGD